MGKKKSVEERFWNNVDKNNDCWFHSGKTGLISWKGRVLVAHRIAYELTYGEVRDKLFLSHTCNNDRCVNPSHLQAQTPEVRFWANVVKTDTCWNWVGQCFPTGYGQLTLGRYNRSSAHRFSYCLHYGTLENSSLLVCHTCDNRKCVNPTHLFLGTHKDNTKDMVKKGRGISPLGERNGAALLTTEQVMNIRNEYATGNTSYSKLAKKYDISDSAIGDIIIRKTWKHLPYVTTPT